MKNLQILEIRLPVTNTRSELYISISLCIITCPTCPIFQAVYTAFFFPPNDAFEVEYPCSIAGDDEFSGEAEKTISRDRICTSGSCRYS